MNATERLRTMDLNLLPVLRELLRRQNVTRASETLNMSQSAVSEALKRLRAQFADDLLVRVGRAMQPTPLARTLGPVVDQALAELEAMLDPPAFDPTAVERQFIIATADSITLTIGAALVRRLAEDAPGVSVQCVDLQWVEARALETGELDFIILPRTTINDGREVVTVDPERLSSFLVYEEEFVCIARKGNPVLARGLDLRDVTTVAYRADPASKLFGAVPGRVAPDRMLVPQFSLLPFLVARSDAVAMVQKHVAEMFAKILDLEIVPGVEAVPPIQVCAFWAPVHENDPAHRWFRSLLREVSPGRAI